MLCIMNLKLNNKTLGEVYFYLFENDARAAQVAGSSCERNHDYTCLPDLTLVRSVCDFLRCRQPLSPCLLHNPAPV